MAQKGAKAIATFGHLEIGEVPGCDPQSGAVVLRLNRCGPEHAALLGEPAQQPIGDLNDLFTPEDADDVIDVGKSLEQRIFLRARPGSRR